MSTKAFNFLKNLFCLGVLVFLTGSAFAAQSASSRSAGVVTQAPQRTEASKTSETQRTDTARTSADTQESTSRSATRRVSGASAQGVVTNRAASRQTVYGASRSESTSTRSDATTARSANGTVARSATGQTTTARSGTQNRSATVSRAASPRATAVFDDVSKIGGGYANCRDSYSTCMDQFCAKANDTYRRCFCSSKFTEFRDTEAALDEAKTLLMRFEDNNLNAVDKTAAEVSAMYSATVGEAAIKNDTSGAADILAEIGDLLSGKKKADTSIRSLSGLTLDFTSELGDIWGDSGDGGIFSFGSSTDLSKLEGQELYNSANKQCTEMVNDSCENNAVFTMARSSYNIFITQDCNLYEKKINTQKEAVTKTVREAEKILREARLEEYRAHNSADVNECITNVKKAITSDVACGANYKKCLDYTGLYIDVNTGDPIYSPQLFKLTELLNLNNTTGNVLQGNSPFNSFLDGKKMFAETALSTCRDKATVVWEEFKRSAIIEIAQAQDSKIEEIKSTCVNTMGECYDTQSGALASFDNTTAQASGALNAYAARTMCADKVAACAALYAGPNDPKCTFDSNGRLQNAQCGMTALLTFVQTVDTVKVAEGCETALINYVKDLCTPPSGSLGYPYECRLRSTSEISEMVRSRADLYCADPTGQLTDVTTMIEGTITNLLNDIQASMDIELEKQCIEYEGIWLSSYTDGYDPGKFEINQQFLSKVLGNKNITGWGSCLRYTAAMQCEDEGVECNLQTGMITLSDAWYREKCENALDGGWSDTNKVCMFKPK